MGWKLLLVTILVTGIAVACGSGAADGPSRTADGTPVPADPESDVEPRDTLSEAMLATLNQKSLVFHQTTVITSGSVTKTQVIDVSMEPPMDGYIRAAVNGQTFDIVRRGEQMFIRTGSGPWVATNANILGYNPESFFRAFDVTAVASGFKLVREVQEGGRTLLQMRAEFNAGFGPRIGDIFREDTPMTGILKDNPPEKVVAEYYVGKEDNLIYRGNISLETTLEGQRVSVTGDFTYSRFNEPVTYPKGLPK